MDIAIAIGEGEQSQCKWIDTHIDALPSHIHDTVDGQHIIYFYWKIRNKL